MTFRAHVTLLCFVCALSSQGAIAGGTDRSRQSVAFMYKSGTYVSASRVKVAPKVTGQYVVNGDEVADIMPEYTLTTIAMKTDFKDKWSLGLIKDTPYGADVTYPRGGAFGDVLAKLDSKAVTGLIGYKFQNDVRVIVGVKHQTLKGLVRLPFANNFVMEIPTTTQVGYMVGAAYEIPEISLRASLDYHSDMEHKFTRREKGGVLPCGNWTTTSSKVTLPRAFNFNFKTGINKNTLFFASARFARYKNFKVRSHCLNEGSLTNFNNSKDYKVGLGYRLMDNLSGSLSYGWRRGSSINTTASPLTPTNGEKIYSIGMRYKRDQFEIFGEVGKVTFGNDAAGIGRTHVIDFNNNDAVFGGLKLVMSF